MKQEHLSNEDIERVILEHTGMKALAVPFRRFHKCIIFEGKRFLIPLVASIEELVEIMPTIQAALSKEKEPEAVRLTEDFLDLIVGMGYPEGTILYRQSSGQYAVRGTKLGGECVPGLFLILDICEPFDPEQGLDV